VLVEGLTAALDGAGWRLDEPAAPEPRRSTEVALLDGTSPLTVIERPGEQVNLVLGVPGLVATDERRSVLSVLNTVFGAGMSSRLFQQIRERRGLAYSVYSFGPGYSDAGVFGMYAGCAPKNAATVAALMRTELERLAHHGVTPEELSRAVGYLGGASALALEDSDTRMSRLGRAELALGEFADLDEALRRVGRVTADDVQALAAVGPVEGRVFRSVVDQPESRTDVA
jgi:predicted Zn-dependent peptidase